MIEIRLMMQDDIEKVIKIEKAVFTDPWSAEGFASALNMEGTLYLVAQMDEEIVGYCGLYKAADQGEIPNVAVVPDCRNQGIGKRMLKELIDRAEESGISNLMLEVRESNDSAKHLYGKLGFEQVGIRKGFYRQPVEDALVLVRTKALICNRCGRIVRFQNGIVKTDFCKVKKEWGYFSEKDGETHRFMICEACYDQWVGEFMFPPSIRKVTELM